LLACVLGDGLGLAVGAVVGAVVGGVVGADEHALSRMTMHTIQAMNERRMTLLLLFERKKTLFRW
jgi:outer membrane lipoprotein SlyB